MISIELYNVAKKNKIGLLFLESIGTKLLNDKLQRELERQREKYNSLRVTSKKGLPVFLIIVDANTQ